MNQLFNVIYDKDLPQLTNLLNKMGWLFVVYNYRNVWFILRN